MFFKIIFSLPLKTTTYISKQVDRLTPVIFVNGILMS